MLLSKNTFLIIGILLIGEMSFAQFSTTTGNITQQSAGAVLIGSPAYTPSSATTVLQVRNGSVLFDGATGTTPMSGGGGRMMWIPAKKAFRAGEVAGAQWDDANIGSNSFACGFSSTASGAQSAAFGNATASAVRASAFGLSTASGANSTSFTNGIASGSGAFAISGTASGTNSFSSGTGTTASGLGASSFGRLTTAYGYYSVAFGQYTNSEAFGSFTIGQHNILFPSSNRTGWISTDPLFVIGNGTSVTAKNNAVTVLKNGNVLIDKATQVNSTYKLDVNGKMRALEIVVNTTGADFVFDENYELMPLNILEQKIKTEKHLPEIASAAEMQANGVGLGELNTKLLQKTEELTLYIIELNKRIETLEQK